MRKAISVTTPEGQAVVFVDEIIMIHETNEENVTCIITLKGDVALRVTETIGEIGLRMPYVYWKKHT